MRLEVIDPLILLDKEDFLGVASDTKIYHFVPMQQVPGIATESLKTTAEGTSTVLKTYLAGNIFMQGFTMFSLSFLWGLVNALMVVAYFPLLTNLMPVNVKLFMQAIYLIATFDLIPTEWLLE